MRVELDGDWTLAYFPEGKLKDPHPDELLREGIVRVPARVPGNVELDLQRTGIIPDPFYADNVRRLLPLELCEWWYTREFEMPPFHPGECWELVFAGLDTLATVWINTIAVGRSANMRVEQRFGEPYVRYRTAVRSLIPRLTPFAGRSKNRWSFALFWRENREQWLILMVIAVAGLMAFRWYLGGYGTGGI